MLVDQTDDEFVDQIVDEFVDQTTGVAGTTPEKRCSRRRSWKARGYSESKKLIIPSMSGTDNPKLLECIKKAFVKRGGTQSRLATGDVYPMSSNALSGKVQAPGEWKSRLKDFTRTDYASSRIINKGAGSGAYGGNVHSGLCREV